MSGRVSLGGVTDVVVDRRLDDLYTSIPAYIVSIENQGELRVNVRPSINMRDESGESSKERADVLNVPVWMPSSKRGGMSYSFSQGDLVMLMFSMRGLERWKRSNGFPTTPITNRKFGSEDAVAFVGGWPFSESVNQPNKHSLGHDPRDVVLYHNLNTGNEVEVRLKYGGGVEVNAPNDYVKVNCKTATVDAKDSYTINTKDYKVNAANVNYSSSSFNVGTGTYSMSATDNATSTGTFSHNGNWILNGKNVDGHTHSGVQSGGSNTDPF